jgi:hypothetical protein
MPEIEDKKQEKKRLAERKRMKNIRKDQDKYALWKLKMKELYLKRKRGGKIVTVQNLTSIEKKIARKKAKKVFEGGMLKINQKNMTLFHRKLLIYANLQTTSK